LLTKSLQVERKRKNQERREALRMLEQQNAESDVVRVLVRNSATGEVLTGDQAPRAEELDTWLEVTF
jgi:hypothetical protein